MSYLLGIDLGTSSVKSLIIDTEGHIISVGQEDYDFDIPQIGYAENDPMVWWNATKNTIRTALAKGKIIPSEIKGIGFSGQMHGLVAVDKNGQVVRKGIIWADQRSSEQINFVKEKIGLEKFSKVTLNAPATGFMLLSLLWVKDNEPENYRKIDKVMMPKDFIRMKLTGKIGTESVDASSSVAFDTAGRHWAWELIDELGLERDLFPECKEACDIAGEIIPEAAAETGLTVGTPVVYGGGDQPMQSVGNGLVRPGYVASNIGTASQIACCVDRPVYDPQLRTNTFCHADKNIWTILGASLNGGIAQKWLRDNIFYKESFKKLDAEAETIEPGSEGLIFLPYLCGERTPCLDPLSRGIFFGLTIKHTKAHMVCAVMEGMVFSLKDGLEIFNSLGVTTDKIIASGGGAKSPLLLQMQADVFEQDIYTTESKEQASFGAAICAGVGVGIYDSLAAACDQLIVMSPVVTHPIPENSKVYRQRYQVYKQLYGRNKDLFSLL